MCLRLCGSANGVAQLHGSVSRTMFSGLWPKLPTDEVPIGSVTNGVHGRTWVGEEMSTLLRETVGPAWQSADACAWRAVHDVPDDRLWGARAAQPRAADRLRAAPRAERDGSSSSPRDGGSLGRRAPRPRRSDDRLRPPFRDLQAGTLLFRDPDRLERLVGDRSGRYSSCSRGRPIPRTSRGRSCCGGRERAGDPDLRDRIVFVEDYDIDAGRILTQGCDLWLNTPVRPNEASGRAG